MSTAVVIATVATTHDAATVHAAERREHGIAGTTLCGKRTDRMSEDTWCPTPTCRVCVLERNRVRSAARTIEAQVAADVAQRAEVADLDARRGGHPGSARVSTSLRFTPEQLAALDAAVRAGYGTGRNAVLARLIDDELAAALERELAR